MKTRALPLTIPDTRIYVSVDVPGKGTHHFRLPRIARALELLELIPQEETRKMVDVLGAGHTMRERMVHYAAIEDRAALIVGELWSHETLELEADRKDGAALAEEFHEAGYTPHEVYSLAASLFAPLSMLLFPVTEAKEDGGFFDGTDPGGDATHS